MVRFVWIKLLADLEHILTRDILEAREGSLQVVECVAHVTLRRKDDGLQAIVLRGYPLL